MLSVIATNGYEKSMSKRIVTVPGTDECAINMINSGLSVEDGTATVQFAGVGTVSSYACYLDQVVYTGDCKSVMQQQCAIWVKGVMLCKEVGHGHVIQALRDLDISAYVQSTGRQYVFVAKVCKIDT